MGYRRKVAIALSTQDFSELSKQYAANFPDDAAFIQDAVERREPVNDEVLLYWSSIKWYNDTDPGIAFVSMFLETHTHDFVRLGDEDADIEVSIDLDSSYGLGYSREIRWEGK